MIKALPCIAINVKTRACVSLFLSAACAMPPVRRIAAIASSRTIAVDRFSFSFDYFASFGSRRKISLYIAHVSATAVIWLFI